VILPQSPKGNWLDGVRDSKVLNRRQRERLYTEITTHALAVGVGMAHHGVIETRNIVGATRLAMRRAVNNLAPAPEFLLIDYLRLPEVNLPQRGITRGDAVCLSIACASIVAKVTRDSVMSRFDELYPGYGLAAHKGYGTRGHMECLQRLGPCHIHRRSFAPVRKLLLPTLL
jgi:ribonuclease HII